MNGAPLLQLDLRASRALATGILLAHVLAAAGILAVLPGAWGLALALLAVVLGVVTARDRAWLRAASSPRRLELGQDAGARLHLADGRRLEVTVAPRRHVSPWWVSLALRGPAARRLLVVRDMLSEEDFRRLRLWALWGRVPGVAGAQLAA